jgi:hypothetical protein
MVLLSREMLKTEGLTLPPHALQCTTDTTIKSALEHRDDTDSIAGASPRGMSPRGASPVYGGLNTNTLHILCHHGNMQQPQTQMQSPWMVAAAAAAAGVGLQGGSPMGRSPRVSISELTDAELVQLGQALTRPSTGLSRHPSLLLGCSMPFSPQHPEAAGNAQPVAHIGVASEQQQQQATGFAAGQQQQQQQQKGSIMQVGAAQREAAAGVNLQQLQQQQQPYPCLGSPFSSPFRSPFCKAPSWDTAAPHAVMPSAGGAGAATAPGLAPAAPTAKSAPAETAVSAAQPVAKQQQQLQRQRFVWLKRIAAQTNFLCRLLLCWLRAWWAQQPLLLMMLITGNFCLYVALCVIWSVMPPCQLGFFIGVGVFISTSAGLAAAACWLHWPRPAGMHPGCCGFIIHLQPQQKQLPQKELELLQTSASLMPAGFTVGGAAKALAYESAVRGSAALREISLRPIDDSAHMPASNDLPSNNTAAFHAAGSEKLNALPNSSTGVNLATLNAHKAAKTAAPCKDCPSSAASEAGSAAVADVLFNDIEWTRTRLLYFQPLMLLIGVASGLLGSSPNTLFLTPMLIGFGQHPQVRRSSGWPCYVMLQCPTQAHAVHIVQLCAPLFSCAFGASDRTKVKPR